MRAHQLKNGVVINTLIVNALDELPDLIDGETGAIGDTYAGGVFTKPVIVYTPEQIAERAKQQQDAADAAAAKADAKVAALGEMAPAQVRNWVGNNVSNLADAKDVLATLAVAVSILARRI